jgi:hypothetical protein
MSLFLAPIQGLQAALVANASTSSANTSHMLALLLLHRTIAEDTVYRSMVRLLIKSLSPHESWRTSSETYSHTYDQTLTPDLNESYEQFPTRIIDEVLS